MTAGKRRILGETERATPLLGLIGCRALLIAISPAVCAQPLYEDRSSAAGIDAAIIQDKPAGGVGVGDFNRDGWPDLFLTGYLAPNRLYFNNGDGTFYEIPEIATDVALTGARCSGAIVADYDNDGWPDVYLVCNGDNYLLRNLGPDGFVDVITPELNHPERTEAAAWADFNNDGRLDLIVGAHPRSHPPNPDDPTNYDRILASLGDTGFVDIAPALAIWQPLSTTFGIAAGDFDLDGKMDLYFVNDRHDGNVLLLNSGPGCAGWCFEDVSIESGADRPAYSMGIAVADYDRDGDWDFYYSSIGEQILLQNSPATDGRPRLAEAQDEAGANFSAIGWGVIFLDADNDGLEDLFLAVSGPSQASQDQLFHQVSPGRFEAIGPDSGLHHLRPSEAAARVDLDRDGKLDLVVGHSGQGYAVYRNISESQGHWLAFELEGGAGINRDAIGARIVVETADGVRQMRERRAGESRNASHDPALHFGLGPFDSAEVSIFWPDGSVEQLGNVRAGQYHQRIYPPAEPVFSDAFERR